MGPSMFPRTLTLPIGPRIFHLAHVLAQVALTSLNIPLILIVW